MARKSPNKQVASPKVNRKPAIMRLLNLFGFATELIAVVILFAGIYDFGFFNLQTSMVVLAAPALATLVAGALITQFTGLSVIAAQKTQAHESTTDLHEKTVDRISLIEQKIDNFVGENYIGLKTENDELKSEIRKIRELESVNLVKELENLKKKNAELQEQLNSIVQSSNEQLITVEQSNAA